MLPFYSSMLRRDGPDLGVLILGFPRLLLGGDGGLVILKHTQQLTALVFVVRSNIGYLVRLMVYHFQHVLYNKEWNSKIKRHASIIAVFTLYCFGRYNNKYSFKDCLILYNQNIQYNGGDSLT